MRTHIISTLAVAAMLLSGGYSRWISDARWWWDITGRTPFYGESTVPFVTENDRACAAIEIIKRATPATPRKYKPIIARATGIDGTTYSASVTVLAGTYLIGRDLAPGRTAVGPFCIEARNPPTAKADLWIRYEFPDGTRLPPFLLGSPDWTEMAAQPTLETDQ